MSTNRLILHIGRHKSGTSSLQRFLCENRGALAEMGFIYPSAAIRGYGHHLFAEQFSGSALRRTPFEEVRESEISVGFLKALREGLERADVVVSSEAFQNCRPSLIAGLFQEFDVQVVVYLREQAGYLMSAYSQRIQAQRESCSLREFERRMFKADYLVFLEKWRLHFGDERLQVRLFDRSTLLRGDIVFDFTSACLGLPAVQVERMRHHGSDQNPSLGAKLVEFIRRLNMGTTLDDVDRAQVYRALQSMASTGRYKVPAVLAPDLRDALKAKYDTSNRRVSTQFLGDPDALRIPDEGENEVDHQALLGDEELESMVADFVSLVPGLEGEVDPRELSRRGRGVGERPGVE